MKFGLSFVFLVMGCTALATAVPSPPERLIATPLGNSSCLNANQTKELKEAITGIQATLTTAVVALDIAAAAEKNPNTKEQLREAARDIKIVSQVLVANLTSIVESACGTCDDIVLDVNETIVAIEQTMAGIEPGWANTTAFKAVKIALNAILTVAETICPSRTAKQLHIKAIYLNTPVANLLNNNSCLNASQTDALKKATAGIQIVLQTTVIALEIAERAETNNKTKTDLAEAVTVVKALSDTLVANLTKIIEEACGTCTQIVDAVNDAITTVEDTLTKIDPDWRNDPLFQDIVSAISSIISFVHVLCDNVTKVFLPRNL